MAAIETWKVEAGGVEMKGAVREIEVQPGLPTEWWFVPIATGAITDLHRRIKDKEEKAHSERGMTGVSPSCERDGLRKPQ
ncbi:MAG: hypothetical protein V3U50_02940 [Acidimicrobiia bacterium]